MIQSARKSFCSHIPSISHCRTSLPQQCDRVWKQQKHIQDMQAPVIAPSELVCIPGFHNVDGVSCYANSVVQCLLHCEPVLLKLLESNNPTDPLIIIARSFVSQAQNMDTLSLRKSIGGQYFHTDGRRQEQNDASEFLLHVLERYPSIQDIFKFTLVNKKTCTNECGYNYSFREENSTLIKLPLLGNKDTLLNMVKNYTDWNIIPEATCNVCGSVGTTKERFEIQDVGQYLLLSLSLWLPTGKLTSFKLTALPSTVLRISNSRFVLKSAIFHHGEDLESGHYTALLKSNNLFIRANDNTIGKERWPNASKDLYMILLEQK